MLRQLGIGKCGSMWTPCPQRAYSLMETAGGLVLLVSKDQKTY